jgi:hypothetical protein
VLGERHRGKATQEGRFKRDGASRELRLQRRLHYYDLMTTPTAAAMTNKDEDYEDDNDAEDGRHALSW